jgi:hypothetical protein
VGFTETTGSTPASEARVSTISKCSTTAVASRRSLTFSPSSVKSTPMFLGFDSCAAFSALSKSSPGMKRFTARRAKRHFGTWAASH